MSATASRLRDLDLAEFEDEANPFHAEPPATSGPRPMHLDKYDAIRDDIQAAYFVDHARVTEFLDAALAHIGGSACSGVEPDNLAAAEFLEYMSLRAKSGVPMYEPCGDVL